jgi:NlpC/P60 family protein
MVRKQLLFALLPCAAVSLPLVAMASAGQDKVTGSQSQQRPKPVQTTRPPTVPKGFRLISLKEGRAIAEGLAWTDDEEGLSPDCSHLVHTLYQQAGYPYTYASSMDLYRGTSHFLRVRFAQPGDLIVWRGHVGIVVNPREHSFFSSVTSGARLQNYDSPYWHARGHARFFRYLTNHPLENGSKMEIVANQPSQSDSKAQVPSAVTTEGANRKPIVQTVKTTPAPAGKAHDEVPSKEHIEIASASATRPSSIAQIPLRSGAKQPQTSDVANALAAASLNAGEMLRTGDLEQLERPVIIYSELQVSGVETKGKHGAAQVQIETLAAVSGERMESQVGWEDHQLELQRTKKGWVMVSGNQNIYIPRDAALRTLAARLAALTQGADRSTQKDREQADIIRFLNLLVE